MPAKSGNLDGKVAFVTGAASGIGRATAVAFAREGANVVVADIDQRGSQDTVGAIEDLGGHALAVVCDMTHGEDIQTSLSAAVNRFGRLDYAFNNAGAEQRPKLTADITEEEWDRITINLRSVFLCLKYEIPLMLQHGGGGAIVNTSSGAGIRVFGRGAAYAAAKHGVVGLTKDAAARRTGPALLHRSSSSSCATPPTRPSCANLYWVDSGLNRPRYSGSLAR